MNSLQGRIKKRLKLILNNFKSDITFSYYLAFLRLIHDICSRFRLKRMSSLTQKWMNEYIMKYLTILLRPVINKYLDDTYLGEEDINSPIWVCWWTGEETAPPLVKKCIESIRKNSGTHTVNIITKFNYFKYIDIPDFILNKVEDGSMCIAHLSDYIRVSLLKKYGGLWLDATIYCSQKIPKTYFDNPFFTCKKKGDKGIYVSDYRWTTFCLGSWRGNSLYSFLQEALELYWNKEQCSIDYLFFDYIINVAYINLPIIKKCIDEVPFNNPSIDELQAAMNLALPASQFRNVIKKDTVLYKLSWREEYKLFVDMSQNIETVYSFFLHMNLMERDD